MIMVLSIGRFPLGGLLLGLIFVNLHAEPSRPRTAIHGDEDRIAGRDSFPVEQDDRRPADQRTVRIFNRPLIIGGELEFAPEWELNPALVDHVEDDVVFGEEVVTLEFLYKLSAQTLLFLETEVFHEHTWFTDNDRDRISASGLTRKQHWILFQRLGGSPFSLQLGRQNIAERRDWWWDTELDGVRLHYERGALRAQIMVAEALGADDTVAGFHAQEHDVRRVLGHFSWRWATDHRGELFFLAQDDHSRTESVGRVFARSREDRHDDDLIWFGLRQSGSFTSPEAGRFFYWADTAVVNGDETRNDYDEIDNSTSVVSDVRRQDVSGWAIDTGITWRTQLPHQPTLTFALAIGSGDNSPDAGNSHAFIQTGLNGNDGKFRGVDRFRYYGEFLRPELSNLAVSTISLGAPFIEDSSIELVYHGYRQLHATNFLRNANLDTDPDGRDPDIGDEIDLVIGVEESAHYEFEFIVGVFRAGSAFDQESGKAAASVQFKMNYNF